MNQEELESLKARVKEEKTKELIRSARDVRKVLAIIDVELQSRKGKTKG